MQPALHPGDGLLALRGGQPRRGQVRVFPDPTLPSRWLVKRVAGVRGAGQEEAFEAASDNWNAPGVVDSRQFGWVPVGGSYRVVLTVRGPRPPDGPARSRVAQLMAIGCLGVALSIGLRRLHARR
jgi:hypothetical protein